MAFGGPATKPGMQGLGQAMGARPQGPALGQAAATKLGQAAGTKLGQAMPPGMGALPPRDMGRPNMPPSLPPAGKLPFGQRPEVPQRPAVQTQQTAPPPTAQQQAQAQQALQQAQQKPVGQTTPSPSEQQALQQAQLDAKAAEAQQKFLQSQQKPPVPVTGVKPMTGGMNQTPTPIKKGGMVSSKPKASSASSRGDGIATKGKTKGRFV